MSWRYPLSPWHCQSPPRAPCAEEEDATEPVELLEQPLSGSGLVEMVEVTESIDGGHLQDLLEDGEGSSSDSGMASQRDWQEAICSSKSECMDFVSDGRGTRSKRMALPRPARRANDLEKTQSDISPIVTPLKRKASQEDDVQDHPCSGKRKIPLSVRKWMSRSSLRKATLSLSVKAEENNDDLRKSARQNRGKCRKSDVDESSPSAHDADWNISIKREKLDEDEEISSQFAVSSPRDLLTPDCVITQVIYSADFKGSRVKRACKTKPQQLKSNWMREKPRGRGRGRAIKSCQQACLMPNGKTFQTVTKPSETTTLETESDAHVHSAPSCLDGGQRTGAKKRSSGIRRSNKPSENSSQNDCLGTPSDAKANAVANVRVKTEKMDDSDIVCPNQSLHEQGSLTQPGSEMIQTQSSAGERDFAGNGSDALNTGYSSDASEREHGQSSIHHRAGTRRRSQAYCFACMSKGLTGVEGFVKFGASPRRNGKTESRRSETDKPCPSKAQCRCCQCGNSDVPLHPGRDVDVIRLRADYLTACAGMAMTGAMRKAHGQRVRAYPDRGLKYWYKASLKRKANWRLAAKTRHLLHGMLHGPPRQLKSALKIEDAVKKIVQLKSTPAETEEHAPPQSESALVLTCCALTESHGHSTPESGQSAEAMERAASAACLTSSNDETAAVMDKVTRDDPTEEQLLTPHQPALQVLLPSSETTRPSIGMVMEDTSDWSGSKMTEAGTVETSASDCQCQNTGNHSEDALISSEPKNTKRNSDAGENEPATCESQICVQVCEKACLSPGALNQAVQVCEKACLSPGALNQAVQVCEKACLSPGVLNQAVQVCEKACLSPGALNQTVQVCEKACLSPGALNQTVQVCEKACLSPGALNQAVQVCEKACLPPGALNQAVQVCEKACLPPGALNQAVQVCEKACLPPGALNQAVQVCEKACLSPGALNQAVQVCEKACLSPGALNQAVQVCEKACLSPGALNQAVQVCEKACLSPGALNQTSSLEPAAVTGADNSANFLKNLLAYTKSTLSESHTDVMEDASKSVELGTAEETSVCQEKPSCGPQTNKLVVKRSASRKRSLKTKGSGAKRSAKSTGGKKCARDLVEKIDDLSRHLALCSVKDSPTSDDGEAATTMGCLQPIATLEIPVASQEKGARSKIPVTVKADTEKVSSIEEDTIVSTSANNFMRESLPKNSKCQGINGEDLALSHAVPHCSSDMFSPTFDNVQQKIVPSVPFRLLKRGKERTAQMASMKFPLKKRRVFIVTMLPAYLRVSSAFSKSQILIYRNHGLIYRRFWVLHRIKVLQSCSPLLKASHKMNPEKERTKHAKHPSLKPQMNSPRNVESSVSWKTSTTDLQKLGKHKRVAMASLAPSDTVKGQEGYVTDHVSSSLKELRPRSDDKDLGNESSQTPTWHQQFHETRPQNVPRSSDQNDDSHAVSNMPGERCDAAADQELDNASLNSGPACCDLPEKLKTALETESRRGTSQFVSPLVAKIHQRSLCAEEVADCTVCSGPSDSCECSEVKAAESECCLVREECNPPKESFQWQAWSSSTESAGSCFKFAKTSPSGFHSHPAELVSGSCRGLGTEPGSSIGSLEITVASPSRMSQVRKRLFGNYAAQGVSDGVWNSEPVRKCRRLDQTRYENASLWRGTHTLGSNCSTEGKEVKDANDLVSSEVNISCSSDILSSQKTMNMTFATPQDQQEAVSSLMSFVERLPEAVAGEELDNSDTMSSTLLPNPFGVGLDSIAAFGREENVSEERMIQPMELDHGKSPYNPSFELPHSSGVGHTFADYDGPDGPYTMTDCPRKPLQHSTCTQSHLPQACMHQSSGDHNLFHGQRASTCPVSADHPCPSSQEMMLNIQNAASESLQDLYAWVVSLAVTLSKFLPQNNPQLHGLSTGLGTLPGCVARPCPCRSNCLPSLACCRPAGGECRFGQQHPVLPSTSPLGGCHQSCHGNGSDGTGRRQQREESAVPGCSHPAARRLPGSCPESSSEQCESLRTPDRRSCVGNPNQFPDRDIWMESGISPLATCKISEVLESSASVLDAPSCSTVTGPSQLQTAPSLDELRADMSEPQVWLSASAQPCSSTIPSAGGISDREPSTPAPENGVWRRPADALNYAGGRCPAACRCVSGPILVHLPLPPNGLYPSPHDSGISSSEGSACDFLPEAGQDGGLSVDMNPRVVLHRLPDGIWEVKEDASSHRSASTADEGSVHMDLEGDLPNFQTGGGESLDSIWCPPAQNACDVLVPSTLDGPTASPSISVRICPSQDGDESSGMSLDTAGVRCSEKSKSPLAEAAHRLEDTTEQKCRDASRQKKCENVESSRAESTEMATVTLPHSTRQTKTEHSCAANQDEAKEKVEKQFCRRDSENSRGRTDKKLPSCLEAKAGKRSLAEPSSNPVSRTTLTEFEKAILGTEQEKLSLRKKEIQGSRQSPRCSMNKSDKKPDKTKQPNLQKKLTQIVAHESKIMCRSKKLDLNKDEYSSESTKHSCGKTRGNHVKKEITSSGGSTKKQDTEKEEFVRCDSAQKSEDGKKTDESSDWYSRMEKAVNDSIADGEGAAVSVDSPCFSSQSSTSDTSPLLQCPILSSESGGGMELGSGGDKQDPNTTGDVLNLGKIIDCTASQDASSESGESSGSDESSPELGVQGNAAQVLKSGGTRISDMVEPKCLRGVSLTSELSGPEKRKGLGQNTEHCVSHSLSELDDGMSVVSKKIRLRKMLDLGDESSPLKKPARTASVASGRDSRLVVLVQRNGNSPGHRSDTVSSSVDAGCLEHLKKRGGGRDKNHLPSVAPRTTGASGVTTGSPRGVVKNSTLPQSDSSGDESCADDAQDLESPPWKKSQGAAHCFLSKKKTHPTCTADFGQDQDGGDSDSEPSDCSSLFDDLLLKSSGKDVDKADADPQQLCVVESSGKLVPGSVSADVDLLQTGDSGSGKESEGSLLPDVSTVHFEARPTHTASPACTGRTPKRGNLGKCAAAADRAQKMLDGKPECRRSFKLTSRGEAAVGREKDTAVASTLETDPMPGSQGVPMDESPFGRSAQGEGSHSSKTAQDLVCRGQDTAQKNAAAEMECSESEEERDEDSAAASDCDVLSICAPSDASFLEDDVDDASVLEKSREDTKESDFQDPDERESSSLELQEHGGAAFPCLQESSKSRDEAKHGMAPQDSQTCRKDEDGELWDAEMELQSETDVAAADPVEADPGPQRISRMAIPEGYCFSFVLHGRCSKTSCPYRHAKPSSEEMFARLVSKITVYCQHGDALSAMDCYRLLQQEAVGQLEPSVLLMLLYCCLHSGLPQPAFQLLPSLQSLELMTQEICTAFVRVCLPFPRRHANLMWGMYEVMSSLGLHPAPDALAGLLRSFYELEDLGRLVPLLNFCSGCEGFKMPTYVVEWALKETAASASVSICRQACQWVSQAQRADLSSINKLILKSLAERCLKLEFFETAKILEEAVQDSPKWQSESEEDCADGAGSLQCVEAPCVQTTGTLSEADQEELKSWTHRIKGCKASRNWQYLAIMFLELSDRGSVWAAHFLPSCLEALTDKSPDRTVHNFKVFFHFVHMEYRRQQPLNALLTLDRAALSRIGSSLLLKLYKAGLWVNAFEVLAALTTAELPLSLASGDQQPSAILLAMLETCLMVEDHTGVALHIVKGYGNALKGDLQSKEGSQLCKILHGLVALEITGVKDYASALRLLVFALDKSILEHDQSGKSHIQHIHMIIMGALSAGDVGSAVQAFDVYVETLLPRIPKAALHPDPLRALLGACDLYGLKEKVTALLRVGKKLCYYPDFTIAPCVDVLPLRSFWMRAEVRAVVRDHVENLYHYLCKKVMDRCPLTQNDLVMVCRTHVMWPPQQVSLPYVSASPRNAADAQELLLWVLGKDLMPPLVSTVSGEGNIVILPASLEKFLQTLDWRGVVCPPTPDQGPAGLHIQDLSGSSTGQLRRLLVP